MSIKAGIKITISAIVLVVIFGYAYLRSESFVRGPSITITTPKNGESVEEPFLAIEGIVKRAAYITLNGRQVYTDETGNLREGVLLAEGYNIFELTAEDRFGRTTKKILEIVKK